MSAAVPPHDPPPASPAPDAHPHLHLPLGRALLAALFAAPLVLAAVGWYVLPNVVHGEWRHAPPAAAAAAEGPPDGARVYAQHCAYCHGARGDGAGPAALNPPARAFGAERFKFAGTLNGVPTDDDLLYVIRHGIPGSAMPEFPQLTDAERRAVAGHVRVLAWRGLYDALWKKGYDAGDDPDPAELAVKVDKLLTPGKPLDVPALAFTPAAVARGRQVFLSEAAGCAKCHGLEGRGDGPQVKDLKNENGTPARPRDLTAGVFKGGRDAAHLYARIMLGIPGTPMPSSSTALKPAEVADLIHYIHSLSPPPAPPAGDGTTLTAGK